MGLDRTWVVELVDRMVHPPQQRLRDMALIAYSICSKLRKKSFRQEREHAVKVTTKRQSEQKRDRESHLSVVVQASTAAANQAVNRVCYFDN